MGTAEKLYLRARYRDLCAGGGFVFFLSSFVFAAPLLILPFRADELRLAPIFAGLTLFSITLGAVFTRLSPSWSTASFSLQEGGVLVITAWMAVIVVSTFPFMAISGLDFSHALFESMSAWTTTGLSVLDVEAQPGIILIFRSVLQLAGGAGLAILMMSAIVGFTGVGVASAEGRSEQLVPHVRESARLVLSIYICYATVGIISYAAVGMSWFDAVNHSFAAVSTGGFSTRVDSIGFWNSAAVEAVTIPLMILGNLSFVTAWLILRKNWSAVTGNGEIRTMAFLVPVASAILSILTLQSLYPGLEKNVRVALFESVTAITTTGFSTVTYGNWNSAGILTMIALMLIGGGACSTAGGIKQFRVYLLWRSARLELRRASLPRSSVVEASLWDGANRSFVTDSKIRQAAAFIFLYLLIFLSGSLVLCACGFSLRDSLFEFASAMGTVGLSTGVTARGMPLPALYAETAAMFLGRLEIFVIFAGAWKLTRDIGRMI